VVRTGVLRGDRWGADSRKDTLEAAGTGRRRLLESAKGDLGGDEGVDGSDGGGWWQEGKTQRGRAAVADRPMSLFLPSAHKQ
jgi:hypothetical protein